MLNDLNQLCETDISFDVPLGLAQVSYEHGAEDVIAFAREHLARLVYLVTDAPDKNLEYF